MDANSVLDMVTSTSFGIWVLIGAALVFFMQAGFAMVETGFTRAKNAGNIIMKNLMDFACGSPYGLLYRFCCIYVLRLRSYDVSRLHCRCNWCS